MIWSQIVSVHRPHAVELITIRCTPFPVCLFIEVSLKNLPLQIGLQLSSHWSYLFQVCVCVMQYIYVIFVGVCSVKLVKRGVPALPG